MAKISELNAGQGNVDVEGTIKEFGEPRTFNKFGRELTVVNAVLEDDSGNIKLSLWNEDATRFKTGDKVKIANGYVSEFQGEPQLTSGKFGSMEKLGGEGEEAPAEAAEGAPVDVSADSNETVGESIEDVAEEGSAEEPPVVEKVGEPEEEVI